MASRYSDPPTDLVSELSHICRGLPEVIEEKAWAGTRWRIRARTFAHILDVDQPDRAPVTVVTFRAADPELDVLRHAGHPFFRAGWGTDVIGMVLDDSTDWPEVAELMTESYRIMAPKKLAATVDGPPPTRT